MSFSSSPPLSATSSPPPLGDSSHRVSHEERRKGMRKMIGKWIMGWKKRRNQNTTSKKSGKRKVINRDRAASEATLWQQYFAEPGERVYDDAMFRRRFRMRRDLFLRIVRDVTEHDIFFTQRPDACGKLGFTPIAKCTAAMRILAYGLAFDQVDEYLSIGETTAKDTLNHFVEAIVNVYREEYLRKPNPQDIVRLKHAGAARGFPGMLGSVDCMHWQWKNCPATWKGQYMGRSGKASIILEAVASYDLRIWHAFFGTPVSCNDINVLDRSPLFDDLLNGVAPDCDCHINGNDYDIGYYLTDGIYPEWSAFIPSIRLPRGVEEKHFAQVQESVRKDVERAFGVLQARFHIIRNPVFYWDLDIVGKTMIACVILHNMIVEDERDTYGLHFDVSDFEDIAQAPWEYVPGARADMTSFLQARFQLRNRANHQQLKNDLIKHVYQHSGSRMI